MSNPLVTICVLTHNSTKTIEKTLKSLLNQDYDNFEILVSDNASNDNTEEIVKSFRYPSITFRKNIQANEINTEFVGAYGNCNGCLKSGLIKGELVAFFHSDDIYNKNIIRKEVEFLLENQKAGAVFTMGNIIDFDDNIIGKNKLPKALQTENIYNFNEIFENILQHGNTFLITPTFMARKNIFSNIGFFGSEKIFGTSGDLEMWLRIAEKYPIGIINENLINRRIGGAGKKYHKLRTQEADFFAVMDFFLYKKNLAEDFDKKYLDQYQCQKNFDKTLRAMNFLLKGELIQAKAMLSGRSSLVNIIAFFTNINSKKIKGAVLWAVLFIGLNLGVNKILTKLLKKILNF